LAGAGGDGNASARIGRGKITVAVTSAWCPLHDFGTCYQFSGARRIMLHHKAPVDVGETLHKHADPNRAATKLHKHDWLRDVAMAVLENDQMTWKDRQLRRERIPCLA